MFKAFAASLIAVLAVGQTSERFRGQKYRELKANEKFDRLVLALEEDKTGALYNYSDITDLFKYNPNNTTCQGGDEFSKSEELDNTFRAKLVHGKGIHGTVRLVKEEPTTEDAQVYTGLYQGADYGILRLSETNWLTDDPRDFKTYQPSVAIKFMVDG